MTRLLAYFFRGLVLVVPLAITAYVCWAIVVKVDGWIGRWIEIPVPGAGLVLTIAAVTLVGVLASNLVTRQAVTLLDRVMTRLPFVRLLYSSTRDLLSAFVGERRRFDRPVVVTLGPGGAARAIGFVTQDSLAELGMPGHVAVYFPQSYNVAGNLVAFPAEQVTPLDADSAAVMAFIVSGGVTVVPGRAPRAGTSGSPSRP